MSVLEEIDITSRRELYDGILSRRVFAFLFDFIAISIVSVVAALVVFFLGIFTFGLGWALYLIFMPLVIAGYLAFTLGGPDAATPGMKIMGIQMRLHDGSRTGPFGAMVHGLLFYLSVSFLTPFVLLVGLFTQRGRLLHDLVLGTYIVRSDYL
uniref:RDD family protein n=1 Tax=Pararhizobium sp. IMCC3301 TaxID=3067904 RepID=UPI0027423D27|nr:RDD family protein [Pararhizobium sp. IMCC3301]